MKTIVNTKRTAARRASAILLSAMTLTSAMLLCTSCTGDGNMDDSGTTAGTTAGTVANTDNGTASPMDPNAGTVKPDGDAGNPPAGTDDGTGNGGASRRFGSDFMR